MKHEIALRTVGVAGIIGALAVFGLTDVPQYGFILAVFGIVSLVAPEVIDQLPVGYTK